MKRLRYQLVDVFTDQAFGGNPLAVFPQAYGLPPHVMQSIAKELNLSETTFVFPPDDSQHDCRVRIFTPAVELPMAGHPTIGTAFVLARAQATEQRTRPTRLTLEEGVGPISVSITWREDSPVYVQMSQPLPVFGPQFLDTDVMARMLSVEPRAITETGLPMKVVSCGVPFLFVPVRSLREVRGIQFRHNVWDRALREFEAPHAFARGPGARHSHLVEFKGHANDQDQSHAEAREQHDSQGYFEEGAQFHAYSPERSPCVP